MREKKEIRINIAIDGPSGVGKSYISKMLAKELNYKFISSGNLYRAIAYNALVNNLDLNDEKLISDSFESSDLDILDDDSIIFKNENITEKLRVNEVSDAASTIAKYQKVREKINHFIQQYSEANKGVIVDGRDATYRILPNAEAKFYMWASPEVRAMRRVRQNKELGINSNYDEVYEALKIRDYNDMNRKVDPLKISEGSIVIDTEHMSIPENFDALYVHILRIIKDKK